MVDFPAILLLMDRKTANIAGFSATDTGQEPPSGPVFVFFEIVGRGLAPAVYF